MGSSAPAPTSSETESPSETPGSPAGPSAPSDPEPSGPTEPTTPSDPDSGGGLNIVEMASNLMVLVKSPAFLDKINGLIQEKLPASMEFSKIGYQTKQGIIEIDAALEKCEGLNTLS